MIFDMHTLFKDCITARLAIMLTGRNLAYFVLSLEISSNVIILVTENACGRKLNCHTDAAVSEN